MFLVHSITSNYSLVGVLPEIDRPSFTHSCLLDLVTQHCNSVVPSVLSFVERYYKGKLNARF